MKRWVIHSRARFTASHALVSYQGRPESPHVHDWVVLVKAGVDDLDCEGMGLDFHMVHQMLAEIVAPLDGTDLNQHPRIGARSPTAERVAEDIAAEIRPRIESLGGTLISVSIWEGADNRVDFNLG